MRLLPGPAGPLGLEEKVTVATESSDLGPQRFLAPVMQPPLERGAGPKPLMQKAGYTQSPPHSLCHATL